MNKRVWIYLITISYLFLSGCVTVAPPPPPYFEKDEVFIEEIEGESVTWRKIAILPFSGQPALRRFSAELFAFHVQKQQHFEIVGPAIAEIELKKKGIELADKKIELEAALEAGRLLGVDAVIVGDVSSFFVGGRKVKTGVSLIDIKSKGTIATSINSGLFPYMEVRPTVYIKSHRAVLSTVEEVANDILSVFYMLAGEEWTPPERDILPKQPEFEEYNNEDLF